MAEGLSHHLHSASNSHSLKGISLHGQSPITHQWFVDDNMLFGYLSAQEAFAFKLLLNLFSDTFGTSINATKSQLFFFHTLILTQRNIAQILGFSIAKLPSKYLGAPLFDSAIKHTA